MKMIAEFIANVVVYFIAKENFSSLIYDESQCRTYCAHLGDTKHRVRWGIENIGMVFE